MKTELSGMKFEKEVFTDLPNVLIQETLKHIEALTGDDPDDIQALESLGSDAKLVLNTKLKYYKKRVICSECNKGEKAQVLTNCLHTFCSPCIDQNIKS